MTHDLLHAIRENVMNGRNSIIVVLDDDERKTMHGWVFGNSMEFGFNLIGDRKFTNEASGVSLQIVMFYASPHGYGSAAILFSPKVARLMRDVEIWQYERTNANNKAISEHLRSASHET